MTKDSHHAGLAFLAEMSDFCLALLAGYYVVRYQVHGELIQYILTVVGGMCKS